MGGALALYLLHSLRSCSAPYGCRPLLNVTIYPWWNIILKLISAGFPGGDSISPSGQAPQGRGQASPPVCISPPPGPGPLLVLLARQVTAQASWLDLSKSLPLGETVMSLSFFGFCFVLFAFLSKNLRLFCNPWVPVL